MNNNLVLKLFPDILAFNLAIYLVTLIALLAGRYAVLGRILGKTLLFSGNPFGDQPVIFKVGECLLFLVFVGLVVFQFCYFYFYHSWELKRNAGRANYELAARSMGQVKL